VNKEIYFEPRFLYNAYKLRKEEKMIVEFSIIPIGKGSSLSRYVAEITKLVRSSGIKNQLNSMGTCLEGEWDEILSLIKDCHERVFKLGVERVLTQIKIDDRRDKSASMESKVTSVEERLKKLSP
jgi:uncharacterized protein (TIGR00106 family)